MEKKVLDKLLEYYYKMKMNHEALTEELDRTRKDIMDLMTHKNDSIMGEKFVAFKQTQVQQRVDHAKLKLVLKNRIDIVKTETEVVKLIVKRKVA